PPPARGAGCAAGHASAAAPPPAGVVVGGRGPAPRGRGRGAEAPPADIMANKHSLTGRYLTGALTIDIPERRPINPRRLLTVTNARGNNLKNVTAEIPLGVFTCITGVSGGGKSTLLIDTLYKAVARTLN